MYNRIGYMIEKLARPQAGYSISFSAFDGLHVITIKMEGKTEIFSGDNWDDALDRCEAMHPHLRMR